MISNLSGGHFSFRNPSGEDARTLYLERKKSMKRIKSHRMTHKFGVSTGLIKIARAFYKLVLFILLCQKKKRSFRSLLVSLFIKIHVCSIEFYVQFTCQTMSTASTSTRNPQRSSVKQFRPLYAAFQMFSSQQTVLTSYGDIFL